MNLTSLLFAAFCIITITIYFIIPKKIQWVVLLISSFIFLFWDNFNVGTIIQAGVILVSTYICAMLIEEYKNTKKSKIFLIVGIIFIMAFLVFLKYSNLFILTINYILKLFGINRSLGLVERNSLIGISYYSLIMIGYLTDIYRGTYSRQRNFFKFALFMSYFPILSSGPFIRYNDIQEDLYGKHKFNFNALCSGLVRILWGVFKILVISQRLRNVCRCSLWKFSEI